MFGFEVEKMNERWLYGGSVMSFKGVEGVDRRWWREDSAEKLQPWRKEAFGEDDESAAMEVWLGDG